MANKLVMVVLNYNDYKTVYEFIDYVNEFNSKLPIIIVDNKSTDESFQELKKLNRFNLSVIQTDKNLGYAYGNNFGLSYAKEKYPEAEYIGISNPDIILNEDCLNKIIVALDKYSHFSSLTGVMHYPDGHVDANPYLTLPTYTEVLLECFYVFRKYLSKSRYKIVDKNVEIQTVEALPGCFFIFRRTSLDKIGGFDNNTFLYYEENILAKRMQQHKMNCGIVTNAKYIHHHSKSISKSYDEPRKMKIFYNSVKYYFRTYENVKGIKYGFLSLLLHLSLFEYKLINLLKKISNN